jgi:hypothetical protein
MCAPTLRPRMAACWRPVGGRLGPSRRLLDDSTTGAQEGTVHHHNIALALAEARVADLRRGATQSGSTASSRRRHSRRLRALALGLAPTAALLPGGALSQPIHDAATPAKAQADTVRRHHDPSATRTSITFTNPLGRSRGPGAGAGLLLRRRACRTPAPRPATSGRAPSHLNSGLGPPNRDRRPLSGDAGVSAGLVASLCCCKLTPPTRFGRRPLRTSTGRLEHRVWIRADARFRSASGRPASIGV